MLGQNRKARVLFGVSDGWLEVYEELGPANPRAILRDSLRMDLSRFFLALYSFLAWAFLLGFRLTANRLIGVIRRELGTPRFVMIVGTGDRAIRIATKLEQSIAHCVRLRGFFSESDLSRGEIAFSSVYTVYPIAELQSVLDRHVVDEVVFAVDRGGLTALEDAFSLCDRAGVRFRVAIDFFPHVNSTVSLDHLGSTPLLTFSAAPYNEVSLLLKRLIHIVIAVVGVMILAPFMVMVAILIHLSSPGAVIFRQVRCGLNGRRFLMYKFPSMCENAEDLKPALEHLNSRGTAFKIPDDPRLTSVGRFLHRFSIDEWPQLWNVLLCRTGVLACPRRRSRRALD